MSSSKHNFSLCAVWASTVPLWGASAVMNAAMGQTPLVALNVMLMVLNGGLAGSYYVNGRAAQRNETREQNLRRPPNDANKPHDPNP